MFVFCLSQLGMEPEVKRLKTDKKSMKNGVADEKFIISDEFSDSERSTTDNRGDRAERAPDAGNEQLPVCKHGLECNEIDLIHFAEFWHPTDTKLEDYENNNVEAEKHEEEECDMVELPNYQVECTQPVFDDEDYSDDEEENDRDDKFFPSKSREEHSSGDSLGSQ